MDDEKEKEKAVDFDSSDKNKDAPTGMAELYM
jgi:hypothetical protein